MKTIFLTTVAFALSVSVLSAQQTKEKNVSKVTQTATVPAMNKKYAERKTPITFLNSTSANAAFAESSVTENFRIADPTIKWYNMMYDYRHPNGNSIIGVPKLSNGLAHGRIIFYPTLSAGSGSFTGSGSVGTGSSLGNIGTNGVVIGVNGRNVYAGPGIYGSRVLSDMRNREEQARSLKLAQKD
jgi:hypothetical protein